MFAVSSSTNAASRLPGRSIAVSSATVVASEPATAAQPPSFTAYSI